MAYQSGFVSIFGKPNAGKSTLLNKLVGEKLAIVSHKVQTTRHRIKAFVNTDDYQIIFSDTPGIINPEYKLHEKMMKHVKSALEDADLALLLFDVKDQQISEAHEIFAALKLKVPSILVINKTDVANPDKLKAAIEFFSAQKYVKELLAVSAKHEENTDQLIPLILKYLPQGDPFYSQEDLSDLPTKFFVSELIREKIFELYHEELPYHTAVIVQEFKEKSTLIKIRAEIIVHRETQKSIIIGQQGSMIKKLGTEARENIEKFLESKVFLELFVKVKPKWRNDELKLREYGY
ncbi:GTPase Era [Polluticaenibacter yanchengensis]|uniref:GTPase Era n=1 Tax=Polluticaenibacter yanchengensis TaxID=3014562 RepID=A0ABT4UI00_9BACT|nr:GTPase Era [Chitinophagaceae bacterium LY-5]